MRNRIIAITVAVAVHALLLVAAWNAIVHMSAVP